MGGRHLRQIHVARLVEAGLDHLVVEIPDAGRIDGADPARQGVAGIDDAKLLEQHHAAIEFVLGDIGILLADQGINRRPVTMEIVDPADDRGLHEFPDHLGFGSDGLGTGLDGVGVS